MLHGSGGLRHDDVSVDFRCPGTTAILLEESDWWQRCTADLYGYQW